MFCDKCGAELPEGAGFCSACGNRIMTKKKNIYVALMLTFILTGLGSIYAGNMKNGLILLAARIIFAVLGMLLSIFFIFSILVWAYGFYEAYRDVQTANGHDNPKLLRDYKVWNQNTRIIAAFIIAVIVVIVAIGCAGTFLFDSYSPDHSDTHYYTSGSGSSSHSSHYGGVDTSPSTIAKDDPDWYYDHYEYGDDDEIDNYLESEGYD